MYQNLSLNKVCLLLNGNQVLNEISFTFKNGAIFSLIGANGAGKTTLLKTIANLFKPTKGFVTYPFPISLIRSFLAYLPAKTVVSDNFKVKEVISWGNLSYHKDVDLQLELGSYLDILSLWEKKINYLSEGEQKRVHLTRVIFQLYPFSEKKILLLDEPFPALDPKHQLMLINLLKDLKTKYGLTILLSHHQIYFLRFTDHIIALKQGRIFFEGIPEIVLEKEKLADLFNMSTNDVVAMEKLAVF
jgi:iron complex transport system ATP-binding protein